MNMNIGMLMQLKTELEGFQSRHPKFPLFLKAACDRGVTEGAVIEISVKTPDGQVLDSNLKLTAEDVDLIRKLLS